MTKSELIDKISASQDHLSPKDVELAIRMILERMTKTLANNDRIEIRGFGSFSLHYRAPRLGRNPKTGSSVELSGKHVPYFKPGKDCVSWFICHISLSSNLTNVLDSPSKTKWEAEWLAWREGLSNAAAGWGPGVQSARIEHGTPKEKATPSTKARTLNREVNQ